MVTLPPVRDFIPVAYHAYLEDGGGQKLAFRRLLPERCPHCGARGGQLGVLYEGPNAETIACTQCEHQFARPRKDPPGRRMNQGLRESEQMTPQEAHALEQAHLQAQAQQRAQQAVHQAYAHPQAPPQHAAQQQQHAAQQQHAQQAQAQAAYAQAQAEGWMRVAAQAQAVAQQAARPITPPPSAWSMPGAPPPFGSPENPWQTYAQPLPPLGYGPPQLVPPIAPEPPPPPPAAASAPATPVPPPLSPVAPAKPPAISFNFMGPGGRQGA